MLGQYDKIIIAMKKKNLKSNNQQFNSNLEDIAKALFNENRKEGK